MISTGTPSKDMQAARLWLESPMRQAQTRIDMRFRWCRSNRKIAGWRAEVAGAERKLPRQLQMNTIPKDSY
jgi:hypothetical protein